jgi:hypothetical protein
MKQTKKSHVVASIGGKGDAGKTTSSLIAAHILDSQNVPWIGIDTDTENASFLRAYGPQKVHSCHLVSAGKANEQDADRFVTLIGEAIEGGKTSVIIDAGAGQWESIEARLVSSGLVDMLANNAITTILFTMGASDENVTTLRSTLTALPEQLHEVPFVLIENHRDGPNKRFRDDKDQHTVAVREMMAARQIRTVVSEAVRAETMALARRAPFPAFLAPDSQASWAQRQYFTRWLRPMVDVLSPTIMR